MQKVAEKLDWLLIMIRAWIGAKLCRQKVNGDSHFVAVLIVIIVVIAVGATFKNQIINFMNSIFSKATTDATALF